MNDTSPEMAQKMCEMIQQKSPIERLKMGCSMYKTSKKLVVQAIRKNNPNLSNADLREEIFKAFYRNDFDTETLERIILHLRAL
jgi:hypothetical protein